MTDTLKPSPPNGSEGSTSTKKTSEKPSSDVGGNVIVRLKSLFGCDHPASGLTVPKAGTIFEADAERASSVVAAGLAELAPAGAKGE